MEKLVAYYKLSRPYNALVGALAVFLGGYVAKTGAWIPVLMAACATVLVTSSSNAYNDYLDIEIDRINQPGRVLPSGKLEPRGALIFSLVLAAISIAIAWYINLAAFLIVLSCNVLLYVYSWRLKSTVLLGNATIALMAAASIILGGVAAGNASPSLVLAGIAGNVILAREILKTMADYEGDLALEVNTVSTVWGMRRAHMLFLIVVAVALIMLLLPIIVAGYDRVYIILIGLGIYPVMLYVMMRVRFDSPAQLLEQMSQVIKYDFLVWFIAVWMGAAPL